MANEKSLIQDIDMVLISGKDLGDVPVIFDGENFGIPSFTFTSSKEIEEADIKGVYFPNDKGGLKLVTVAEFKELYKGVKATMAA